MMNESGLRRILPDQLSGSAHSFGTPRHASVIKPILSKRVCFYKSGDPQFNGLHMVINNRTFKTFDALLDSLSKKVPLPFGVRNITTPRGVHAIYTLDELEDGKSYICSDSRKVKPINLAMARKKLPPWYNARPASSRRRTVQQARFFPGRKKEQMVVRTPKKLLVFRNGVPAVKHSVVIHKRSTPTFEAILEYISELLQFHVVKLHTPDGRRVDGLPSLILCSGIVVAAGREPFRSAGYNAQKSSAAAVLPNNQMGLRRLKAFNRNKKALLYTSKSRPFSPSSERYIVNRIHDSIVESSCDLPSNATNSMEVESGHLLESVAETDTCLVEGAAGQDGMLPTEDDIEKSFRVNQDGSMTVEMKVRLTIKEEETIHWTTTLTRSSVANQQNADCLPELEPEHEISSTKSNSLDLQSPAASIDTIKKDKNEDDNDEDPPSLGNGAFTESSNEDDYIKVQTSMVSPRRSPTPGHKLFRKKQASLESLRSVMAEGVHEAMTGSYYREQAEQYCMVKQSSSKPVPKPRRFGSVDSNNINSRSVSTFKSAELTEILQIESSGDEVTETVLHIYEKQTCQDHFSANLCAQGLSASGIPFGRPATSGTGQLSPNNESELCRPSTASESISIWRTESMSVTSDFTLPSLNTGATNAQQGFLKITKGPEKPQQREVKKDKKTSSKPKVINKRVRRLMTPGKRQKDNSTEPTKKLKKVKTFSSAGFLKKIYGSKSKSHKNTIKHKTQNGDVGLTSQSSEQMEPDGTIKCILKNPNGPLKENGAEMSMQNGVSNKASQPRGILTRQTSMHQEKKNEHQSYDVSKIMSLPAFNSSTSVTNEYVEDWLEKAHHQPTVYQHDKSKKHVEFAENGKREESENMKGFMTVAQEVKCLEETSEIQTSQTLKTECEIVRRASVRQRIQSFENKSSSPSVEKPTIAQQTANGQATSSTTERYNSLAQSNITNNSCSEMPSGSENYSNPIKISLQNATPSPTLSMEFPPPPPPAENIDSDYGMMDEPSAGSSPLYGVSSVSSQMSDHHPLSISPTSAKAASPTDHTMEMTTPIQADIPSAQTEETLQRAPSIKRAPLVSNPSLDRKMSLRKTRVDKYTLCNDATSETSSSSPPVNIVDDNVLPNNICSSRTEQQSEAPADESSIEDLKNCPSSCSSAYPTSLASGERTSSASVSSSEAPTPSDLQFKEAKTHKTQLLTQKEAGSPKPVVKKEKLMSSPSPERKSQSQKSSPELTYPLPPDQTVSPNVGRRKHATNKSKRASPYSQSLDMASPSVRHKSNRTLLSDKASEPTNTTQRETSQRKCHQTQESPESTAELDQTGNRQAELSDGNTANNSANLITETSMAETQITPRPLSITDQPNIKPVLEEICYSIKSIRQIIQNKRPSCLEKSNSLPDFSTHVASTFGSSSKALLAFLSVMILKEGIANPNMNKLNANEVSCAEALRMIDSLREIATIEDSHKLKASLTHLQQSASKQLLQSWKGFQELSDKCKSRSSTPDDSDREPISKGCPEKACSVDENVIDEIMDNLDIPEKLKEELASLSVAARDNDDEEEMSEKIEVSPEGDSNVTISSFSTEESINVRAVTQEEKANVDVSAIIKRFTDINQPKQSSMVGITETAKHKPTDQETKDTDIKYRTNGVATCPPEHKQEERQLHGAVLVENENGEGVESHRDVVNQENHREREEQKGCDEDKSNQGDTGMNIDISWKKSLRQDSCSSEAEEKDMEDNELQVQKKESTSVPENEHIHDDESEQEGQKVSGANKDLEQKLSCQLTESSSEEELEVQCEGMQQEHREDDDKKSSFGCYVELNVSVKGRESSPERENEYLSEEEQPEVEHADLNKDASSPSNSEEERESPASYMGQNVSVDESTCNSDADEPYSEEEQPEVESRKLKVIIEESLSGNEEEQESTGEEEHLNLHPDQTRKYKGLQALKEEPEEDRGSSEDKDLLSDETHTCDESRNSVERELSSLIENLDPCTKKENGRLISLEKPYGFSVDEDSGNDHSSCEEHVEADVLNKQISSSIEEEELSYYEKESSSEEEHVERYIEQSCAEHWEASPLATQCDVKKCEKAVEKVKHVPEERISKSIAERVILLEKQVADAQKRTQPMLHSPTRHFSRKNVPLESDGEDSEHPTSESAFSSRSAPQSSLSFSYDSSGVITTEPEGNRVRSIREMFLAKSSTDIQHGHRRFPSSNASDRSEFRAETSVSGGYQSQTSSDLSSGEDDSARKSITKGFVRRTIERLYGKKEVKPDEEAGERPTSAQKQKKKEYSSLFSPFHTARSKAMSELSYFSSTNTLDTLGETTRCLAFNAQVGPGDGVPMDNGQWLLGENTLIRKSVSDPAGINKDFTNSPQGTDMCKDTEEETNHSFTTKSELEDKKKSFSRKCTYFSLPHASDSDAGHDDQSPASKNSTNADSVTENKDRSEDTKVKTDRNGMLSGVTDFKMMDNKVHPLTEVPADSEVVVEQPGRGQGVVNRRIPEPDVLDLLYNFCGQNCPIL